MEPPPPPARSRAKRVVYGWFQDGLGSAADGVPRPFRTPYRVRRGPGPRIGVRNRLQQFDSLKVDCVDRRIAVRTWAAACFDQDAFGHKFGDSPLDSGASQLCLPGDGTLAAPDTRTIIAGLVSQIHDDLLAHGTAEPAFSAGVGNLPAHSGHPCASCDTLGVS